MPSTNSTLACANAATIAWVTGISVLIGGVAIDGNSFLALRIPSAAEGGQTLAVVWRRRRRTAIIGTRDDRPPGRDPPGGIQSQHEEGTWHRWSLRRLPCRKSFGIFTPGTATN